MPDGVKFKDRIKQASTSWLSGNNHLSRAGGVGGGGDRAPDVLYQLVQYLVHMYVLGGLQGAGPLRNPEVVPSMLEGTYPTHLFTHARAWRLIDPKKQ